MNIRRFDILLVDFGKGVGSEQNNVRPAVVVGNDASCNYSPVLIVMPFTSNKGKSKIPTHCIIKKEPGGLHNDSLLIGEQPTPIDRLRVLSYLGHIENEDNQAKINKACIDAFFYKH